MYLRAPFDPPSLLIVRMRLSPGFHVAVAAMKISGILPAPVSFLKPLTFLPAFSRSAAYLALAYPRIRHKKSPAANTLLSSKTIRCFHVKKCTGGKRSRGRSSFCAKKGSFKRRDYRKVSLQNRLGYPLIHTYPQEKEKRSKKEREKSDRCCFKSKILKTKHGITIIHFDITFIIPYRQCAEWKYRKQVEANVR